MDEPQSNHPRHAHQLKPTSRQRVLRRLDGLVRAGRVTEDEAARLRAADDPGAFDQVVRGISARHARAKLNAER